jgi:large subunit ribosomal protein L21
MLSHTLRKTFCQLPSPIATLPPTFLLPLRARLLTTEANTIDPEPAEAAFSNIPPQSPHPTPIDPTPPPLSIPRNPRINRKSPLQPPTNEKSLSLLPLLAAQTPHYITAHLHARPYLLTLGDTLRLPFHLPNAPPGTILRLNRASLIGSREYTFRGDPWIDERLFVLRAVVVGVEGEPMRVVEKKKRRQRRVTTVKSKMRFTILRVRELRVLSEGMRGEESGTISEEKEAVEALASE